jgi:hypothetical protein
MQRRTLIGAAGTGALAALTAGCAATPEQVNPNNTRLSLLFGYIDSADSPTKIEWVQLRRYGDSPGYYRVDYERKTGLFMHVGVEPGSLQVHTFGGGNTIFNWHGQGRNASAVTVGAPGAYFVGAFKYVHHDEGFLKADKFEMLPLARPSESDVLGLVLRRFETDGDLAPYVRQRDLARQRLAAIGGRRV